MKDKLYEKYGYKIDYLTYKNGCISFQLDYSKYMLLKTELSNESLTQLDMIIKKLDNYAIFFHQLIRSKDGFVLEFGKDKYVLIKLRIVNDRKVTINEIIKLSNINIGLFSNNVMEEKIDFIENYLSNNEKTELVNIDYFIGISENSIALFNLLNREDKVYIGHKRIKYNEKAIDFYNPLNIVLDYKTRDLAEYVKSSFISGNNQMKEVLKYLNPSDYLSYFARLLFPSFYFDMVDQYINYGIEMDIKKISNLANSFEKSLRETYNVIFSAINIPYIDWLSKVNNF